MHRNFLRGLLIALVPTALFGAFAWFGTYRPGIDLAGGTILVYELDLEKLKDRQAKGDLTGSGTDGEGLSTQQMQDLAESLKKRIDPVDTRNVIIRPVGSTRVEIIVPFTPKKGGAEETAGTEDFVQFVKEVVSRVGVLEFRIVADIVDDEDGLRAAEAAIAAMSPQDAERLARLGQPPPNPTDKFNVKINDIDAENVSYEWVEIGREERQTLELSNAFAEGKGGLYGELAERRGKTYRRTYSGGNDDGKNKSLSMLLYSREFKKENPSKDDDGKGVEYFMLTRVSAQDSLKVGGNVGLRAKVTDQNQNWVVGFEFTNAGISKFTAMTDRNRPTGTNYRALAVVLDDRIVTAPSLNSRLDGAGIISGKFTKSGVERLVYILRSGALTAQLKPNPVSENSVGPTLGRDTINKGLWSVGLAFAAVLAFMLYYYRFAGVVACIALLVNLILTIGFMNAVSAAYTLAGLAGIVLMLGMAVDANVLIYERVREERAKGMTLINALRAGYERALPTIIDTHLTSIFTAIVLYTFGNDNLKGFAVSLTVGLIISLFTALYVTRLIFDWFIHRKLITDLKFMSLFSRPNIDFMAIRKQMFTLTAILTVLGLALFLIRGERGLNVDFRGGTAYGGRLSEPLSLGKFLEKVSDANQKSKLVVKDVARIKALTDGVATDKQSDDRTFNIYYAGATDPVVVTLSNDPAGPGKPENEQIDALKLRASHLPDASVEQVYVGNEKSSLPGDSSKSFTFRTTEREPDLVQAILDRLLRDDADKPLIAATTLTAGPVTGSTVELKFSEPTSVNYVKGLLKRQFRLEYREPSSGEAFTLTGVTEGDKDAKSAQASSGKFKVMTLDVSKNAEFKSITDADAVKAKADADALTKILTSTKSTFESRPVPERLETFDAALAEDTKSRAFYAIVASWVAIMLYLWFRFGSWTFGLAAVVCLIHDLCFTLGCIAVCHYLFDLPVFGSIFQLADFKIDLATVAALLTLVGYSVNDTIVVFDRIREVRGKNPKLTPQMINDSVNQTLSRTVLASLTVFLVVGVLYFFGGEGVHLFSFVMVVGVIVGTYSSIYIASPLLLIFGEGQEKVDVKKPAQAMAKV